MSGTLETIPVRDWGVFRESGPYVIAGPCSAETEEQVLATAKGLCEQGIGVFRAGIWKPRTHPGCFEGVGPRGLDWMRKAREEYGLRICTEVAGQKHVCACLEGGVDLVWIGARTTANPFLVQEIAEALRGTDIPVLVKNPVNPDLGLWTGALERLSAAGIRKLGAVHRGVSSFDKIRYRNNPQWQLAIELRSRFPQLPLFTDPSHLGGKREYVGEISQRSLDLGFEGLMIESHCNPACALSDAGQQLTPGELGALLRSLTVRASEIGGGVRDTIDELRARIDVIDENLLDILASRMRVSREIGRYKRDNNIAIVQASRWETVLSEMVRKAGERDLPEQFVRDILTVIHEASVLVQNEILSGRTEE